MIPRPTKQVRTINLRPIGCGIISRCLDESPEDANRIVAEQIVRLLVSHGLIEWGEQVIEPQCGNRLPVRTNADIMRECMTPEALAVKRNTRGILQ